MNEKGNLSINSENFLPIIKKWLYTDKDIFVRELVSNACDAVTKLQKLARMGEAEIPEDEKFEIHVVLNQDLHILQIIDNGIGMTANEIKKYINQIAFSGATDFLAKFQEKAEQENEIIGHFGLGFYSAFMVADKVEIDTLSYQAEAQGAKWLCEGGIDYEMDAGNRETRGTTITLYLGEDGKEFLEESTLYAALRKYCSFMPVPIFVDIVKESTEAEKEAEQKESNTIHISPEEAENLTKEDALEKLEAKKAEDNEDPKPLNDTTPLWQKQPKDCTDEEYKAFYHQVFFDMNDPLFWIHLNMDYPFRLKGILYFPKLVEHMDVMDGEIKLYANQVYIADNIKEVVPEFLLLLKGVLDCPDMPLNVSRSALQNDGYVEKMSTYITKKVADKLTQLFKNERSVYESFWNDIGVFIKYGCMREEKFYDKVKDALLFKTTDGVYETLPEYLEKNKEKHENKLFFVSDENLQAQYIRLFKEQGLEAAILSTPVDKPFVSFLEYKNTGVSIQRIDADISETLQKKEDTEISEAKKQAEEHTNTRMEAFFRGLLQNDSLKVSVEDLKAESISAMLLLSEKSRRMLEMMEAYGNATELKAMFADVKPEETLVLNRSNGLVKNLLDMSEKEEKKEDVEMLSRHVYDLALMSHRPLTSEEMTSFIDRSNILLEKLSSLEAGR
ncbi:molecular chaperone HtpG [Anaerotignum propionicum]|uniref:Chaperone protein HtpG n=2 Tax=root TaxID=1 RepID=A0A110A7G2_ANAPI|nr:molecular chaperone HtpG [Anaerotignum propionicum]AMJ42108.1 chaperone protein HtpG [Anaerotignum propionicum DSM 1682]SHE51587.1 molecular chaperone HtpG [[Clostridium] propionicum DSM 1682] [Anaerotignum propionicum DSM 1682]